MAEKKIEIRIALEIIIQIVEVKKNRGPADLRIIRVILIEPIEFFAFEILGGVFRHGTEKIG